MAYYIKANVTVKAAGPGGMQVRGRRTSVWKAGLKKDATNLHVSTARLVLFTIALHNSVPNPPWNWGCGHLKFRLPANFCTLESLVLLQLPRSSFALYHPEIPLETLNQQQCQQNQDLQG